MARVVIEHLTKDFPVPGGGSIRAVDDLSFTVEDSEWLVLVGPSGCGKTTTLRLVAGLEQPTLGDISFDGRQVNTVPAGKRNLAMVFQTPALYPHLSAFENMAFGLRVRKVPRRELASRVQAAAETLGVADCLSRRPMELSGGQRQRIALGRALVRQPSLLLLDEPLANLDPQTQAQLRAELLELRGRVAAGAIYVTHDQQEAMILGSRLGVLKSGALQQLGPARELYDHPANLFVAGFLGSPAMNFLKGSLERGADGFVFTSADQTFPAVPLPLTGEAGRELEARVGRPAVLGLRPEHIRFSGAPAPWQAGIEAVEEVGPDKHVHLQLGREKLVARVPASQPAAVHERVGLSFEVRMAHLFAPETERTIL